MITKYLIGWVPMLLLAMANGAIRDSTYGKRIPEPRAHQISTLTGIVVLGAYIYALTRFWKIESPDQAATIGLIWFALTVCFEFLFGRLVAGQTWEQLFQNYNVFAGRLWPVLLTWITVAPYIFYRL
ncbi:MAG: hypothetical protein AAGU11_22215 [Syntrophobacteraceae bacterium]